MITMVTRQATANTNIHRYVQGIVRFSLNSGNMARQASVPTNAGTTAPTRLPTQTGAFPTLDCSGVSSRANAAK